MSSKISRNFKKNPKSYLSLIFLIFLLFVILITLFIKDPLTLINKAKERRGTGITIALRVPDISIFDLIDPYRNGTKGNLSLIYYGNLKTMQEISLKGVTTDRNPAQLGVLIGCSEGTINTLTTNINDYIEADITYLIMDCERGPDRLWGQPNVAQIVSKLKPIIRRSGHNFRLQTSMQFGFLENTSSGEGDKSVCPNRKDRSTCNFTNSYANQVWMDYDRNDIMVIFGESGQQINAEQFEKTNQAWVGFIKANYPSNDWWGITGMVPKTSLNPTQVITIAERAESMGAKALGIIYLGRTANEFQSTGILPLLDLLVKK